MSGRLCIYWWSNQAQWASVSNLSWGAFLSFILRHRFPCHIPDSHLSFHNRNWLREYQRVLRSCLKCNPALCLRPWYHLIFHFVGLWLFVVQWRQPTASSQIYNVSRLIVWWEVKTTYVLETVCGSGKEIRFLWWHQWNREPRSEAKSRPADRNRPNRAERGKVAQYPGRLYRIHRFSAHRSGFAFSCWLCS